MTTIQERLDAARLLQGKGTVDDFSSYERQALLLLVTLGYGEKTVREVEAQYFADAKERYLVWLAESVIWTITEIRAGRNREALRGLLQIYTYSEKVPNDQACHFNDCKMALRVHFEDLLQVPSCEKCHQRVTSEFHVKQCATASLGEKEAERVS